MSGRGALMGPDPYLHLYDRQGHRITMETYALLCSQENYRWVGSTQVGPYLVSTVWLGVDHSFGGDQAPLVFETMVFLTEGEDEQGEAGWLDRACTRYAGEEEALQGHQEWVATVRATTPEASVVELRGPLGPT